MAERQQVMSLLAGDDLEEMGLKPDLIYKKILGRLLEGRLNRKINTNAAAGELVKRRARIRRRMAARYRGR